jgi:hypothetical protein
LFRAVSIAEVCNFDATRSSRFGNCPVAAISVWYDPEFGADMQASARRYHCRYAYAWDVAEEDPDHGTRWAGSPIPWMLPTQPASLPPTRPGSSPARCLPVDGGLMAGNRLMAGELTLDPI